MQNGSTTNTSYDYDTLDRMISFTASGPTGSTTNEYTFDGYNRATEKVTAIDGSVVTKNYSYDETNWLTKLEDGAKVVDYSYDANGNTVRKSDSSDPGNDTVFQYDSANRLVRSMRGTTVLGLYDYDAEGMRIRHRNSDRGDVDYFYDGRSVIEERNAGGGLLAYYNYADRLMSLATGSDTQYYHFDALGSTVNLTDAAGANKISYFLNPWGMILSQIGESTNRRVFTGKEQDVNTGLVYFGARYYDAETGRFMNQDTYLGEQGVPPSLHRYLYAHSNPTAYIDIEGYAAAEPSNVDRLLSGANNFWKATTTALSKTRDALPVISREANNVPTAVANSFTPKTTAGQMVATALYTAGEFINSNVLAPLSAAGSIEDARQNPTKTKIALAILATSPYVPKGSGKVVQKVIGKELVAGEKLLTKEARSGGERIEKIVDETATELGRTKKTVTRESQERALTIYKPWPDDGGFLGGYSKSETAKSGRIFSRIGALDGTYVAPPGTSISARGLPSDYPNKAETMWEVIDEVGYKGGIAAPWKDASGLGQQYKLDDTVENLWKANKVKPYIK